MKKLRGRKYKYSNKQMRYFASISKSPRKALSWMNRLYKQKIKQAIRLGEMKRVKYILRAKATIKYRIKKFGVKKQTWTIATKRDIYELAVKGTPNKEQGKLLIIDNAGNTVKIAYAGSEAYEEALEERNKWFTETGVKPNNTKSIEEMLTDKGVE